ncbi:MAG: hypothetical protein HXY20_13115 [Acidobacteria bacterium]|nr:hypothetical protein [Acidobacteriota bacterium]
MRTTLLAFVAVAVMQAQAGAVDVPLNVREADGVARVGNPVNSGIPLPRGAVTEAGALRLMDARGRVVPASIEPRSRWIEDGSLQWVTVHFVADLEAGGTLRYRLITSGDAAPPNPIDIREENGAITVTTGPARFVIPTDRLAPFGQVYMRGDLSRDFAETDAVLSKPASVVLTARPGESRVVPRPDRPGEFRSELVRIGYPLTQTAAVQSVLVEERGPGRAVVALKGTFSTPEAESLDFTARLYFYGGSPLAQMTFSVINRQMDSMARFVGIERLAVEIPLKGARRARVALSREGKSFETALGKKPLSLIQTAHDRMRITASDGRVTEGAKSDGWVQVRSRVASLIAGTRWFWQVYPMGLAVRPDGTLALELKPSGTDRVDLYTAGAKTHFLFFHFAAPRRVQPAAVAAGTTHPLVAAPSPDWYCQETRVMGDLFSDNPELYDTRYRDLVSRFQNQIDRCLNRLISNRPRPGWKVDEYGWLNFGSGLHHYSYVRENARESWWDGNYYDFPHAVILNYLRTGDLVNLTTAEEAGLHLADLDICHSFPGRPERAGSPRSGPVVGHFRNYARGQNYEGHDSFTFYKNESLYELYYLTGERWYREVGLMSSDFAMAFWGKGALRNLAHGIWGVLSAYRDTHEPKYLDRARFFVDRWGKPWQDANQGSFKDQQWMYGLVFEAYDKYYRLTGDKGTAEYLVKALDALIREFWRPEGGTGGLDGINLIGYGLGYEYTGDEEYLRKGLVLLERLSRPGAEGDRVKTFAQNFRASPYFLKYLTAGYRR